MTDAITVIADCLKQLRRPGARTTDAGDAAFVTAALAAAGYVVVPRKINRTMIIAGTLADASGANIWSAMIVAAEAKEASDGQ